jgi:DNA-binding NarL/FixJ family response regulator
VLVEVDCSSRERLEAVQLLKRLLPTAKTLLVSALSDPAQLKAWGCCSITGCVAKSGGIEELRAAINAVLAGNTYFSSGTDSVLRRGRQIRTQIANLSRREAELLPLLAKGCTLREAAAQLSVAYKTADSHRTNLLRKLGLHDRVELARFAIREGLVAP